MIKKLLTLLTVLALLSCDEEPRVNLNVKKDWLFSGTFKTISSDEITGTVNLTISNEIYECTTSLPFGHGAGKVEANRTTINFIDTVFFAGPAMYGPSYVLSGEHHYEFDGRDLKIWKAKNVGEIKYHLTLVK